MNTDDTLLRELEDILYGRMRIEIIHKKYQQEGAEDFEGFWDYPKDLKQHMMRKSDFFGVDLSEDDMPDQSVWIKEYYNPVIGLEDDKHVLLRFYRIFTRCERNRLMYKLQQHTEQLEHTLLKYILGEVRNGIIDMLRELKKSIIEPRMGYANNLRERVLQLVFNEMAACLFELELRFEHIFDHEVTGYERLFLQKLTMPLPEVPEFYITEEGARHLLQKEMISSESLKRMEDELKRHYSAVMNCSDGIHSDALRALDCLECGWVFGKISFKTDEEPFILKQTYEGAENHLKELYENIIENKAGQQVIKAAFEIKDEEYDKQMFNLDDHINTARKLMADTHPGDEGKLLETGTDNYRIQSTINPLAVYLQLHGVANELEVNMKTLKKYLNEAAIETVPFSQKTEIIHFKEVEKLIEYYKVKHGQES